MSKSRGNVIYADELAKLIGTDGVRYYLLAEMPYAQDGTITYERVFDLYNSDLANTLGNLVNRTIAMTQRYFAGKVPEAREFDDLDAGLAAAAKAAKEQMLEKLDAFHCADSLQAVMNLAKRANKYIDETEPWVLGKNDNTKGRLAAVLYNLLETVRYLGVLLSPFLPDTSTEIFRQINCPAAYRSLESIQTFGSAPAFAVEKPSPLFARLDVDSVLDELAKNFAEEAAGNAANAAAAREEKPLSEITYDAFMETVLLAGEVRACQKVEKADKLLQLAVYDGTRERTIVSGIAQWYQPDGLVGKKIVLVSNLKPAKMRGITSEGMLLAVDGPAGEAQVVFLPDEAVPGSRVR